MAADDPENTFTVVINHEEQYSIWPAHRATSDGWRDAGFIGGKRECLAYVEAQWRDMRPLSLRRFLEDLPLPAGLTE